MAVFDPDDDLEQVDQVLNSQAFLNVDLGVEQVGQVLNSQAFLSVDLATIAADNDVVRLVFGIVGDYSLQLLAETTLGISDGAELERLLVSSSGLEHSAEIVWKRDSQIAGFQNNWRDTTRFKDPFEAEGAIVLSKKSRKGGWVEALHSFPFAEPTGQVRSLEALLGLTSKELPDQILLDGRLVVRVKARLGFGTVLVKVSKGFNQRLNAGLLLSSVNLEDSIVTEDFLPRMNAQLAFLNLIAEPRLDRRGSCSWVCTQRR